MYKKEDIIDGLIKIGLKRDDDFICHISTKALGSFENGFKDIECAFKEFVGETGTVLFPAFSYMFVNECNPLFDNKLTQSNIGAFPEFFRKSDGVVRSTHPSHSLSAFGKNKIALTQKHILDTTPVGENSPLTLLARTGGKILMIGCTLMPNSSMHGVEEEANRKNSSIPSYLYAENEVNFKLIDENNNIKETCHKVHGFKNTVQRYDRVENILDERYLKKGNICGAQCFLIDSKKLYEKCSNKMLEDSNYFVDFVKGE